MLFRARGYHSLFWSISTSFEQSNSGYSWPEHVTVHSGKRPQYLRSYMTRKDITCSAAAAAVAVACAVAAAAATVVTADAPAADAAVVIAPRSTLLDAPWRGGAVVCDMEECITY